MYVQFLILLCGLNLHAVKANRDGSVTDSCQSIIPGQETDSSTLDPPYTVTSDASNYANRQLITVTLQATETGFRGFLLQAIDGMGPVGTFTVMGRDAQLLNCSGIEGSAVSHTSDEVKSTIVAQWRAPDHNNRDIQFRATFVQNDSTFWVGVLSNPVIFLDTNPLNTTVPPANATVLPPTTVFRPNTTVLPPTTVLRPNTTVLPPTTVIRPNTTVLPPTTVLRPNTTVLPQTTVIRPNTTVLPQTTVLRPNTTVLPQTTVIRPNTTVLPQTTVLRPNTTVLPQTTVLRPNTTVLTPNATVLPPNATTAGNSSPSVSVTVCLFLLPLLAMI